jgi:hypothetical protein
VINETAAKRVGFEPGKPTVSATIADAPRSAATHAPENHDSGSSIARSCTPTPIAAATPSKSSTDRYAA